MWQSLFVLTNVVAFTCWAMLAFLPRKPMVMASVLFFGVGWFVMWRQRRGL